jgi:hypothetical protein
MGVIERATTITTTASSSCSKLASASSFNPAQLRAPLPSFIADVTMESVMVLVQKQHMYVLCTLMDRRVPRRHTLFPSPPSVETNNSPNSMNAAAAADSEHPDATADSATATDFANDIAASDSQTNNSSTTSFKQETHDSRQGRFPEDWSLLQLYCLYKVLSSFGTAETL